jgi:hypothetical protein
MNFFQYILSLDKGDRDDCNKFVGTIAILLNIIDISGFQVFCNNDK